MIYKKTKIICTIGPAVESVEKISELVRAGMDAARLNFSHGSHDIHKQYIENIREASKLTGKIIPIIQDLSGPKIRIGKLENGFAEIKDGELIDITPEQITGNAQIITLNYPDIINDLKPDDIILIDDGNLKLVVREFTQTGNVRCEVIHGGEMKERKGVNLPLTDLKLPSLTEKDLADLAFGLENGIDFIAMSFVRTADDIKLLKGILKSKNSKVPIISKIERPEAITNIDEIINESDLIMVARGDLGVELSSEEVPLMQKMIIKKCNEKLKPVITATQMLESMVYFATPTRAEASDIANAILDGTDCVMLSAETSTGKYPVKSVEFMRKIILKTETIKKSSFFKEIFVEDSPENTLYTICNSAAVISTRLNAKAIITISQVGKSPLLLSSHRPAAQIINATFSSELIKRSKLIWGVESIKIDEETDTDFETALAHIKSIIIKNEILSEGDRAIIITSLPFHDGESANTIIVSSI